MLIIHHHLYVDFPKEKSFRIRPHSDTQIGNPDTDMALVRRMVKETAEDPLALSLGAGDIIDTDRPSARVLRTSAYAGRESELAQEDMKRMDWLDHHIIPLWKPMVKSKNIKRGFGLLGELDGHHHEVYQNGMTSTEYLMRSLRDDGGHCKYLGEMMCYVVLHVHRVGQTKSEFTITIHLQHGAGGSQYISSDMTALERKTTPYFEADIFLRGHSTKKYGAMRPILYPSRSEDHPQLLEKTIVMANTGGYLRGYGPGAKANYVEAAGLAPVTLGHVVIHVKLCRDDLSGKRMYPEFSVEV